MKEFSNILKYARPYTKSIIFAFACLILTSMISLALPLIVRNMINAVVVLKSSDLLNSLTRNLVIIILFQAAFAVTHNYILSFIGHRVTADFRIELFSHIQSLSLRFFQSRRVGEILSRMSNDITVIQNALVSIPVAVLRQTITLLGALAIIFYLNWKLTGLILLVLPPLMLFARIFGKRLRNLTEKVQDKIAREGRWYEGRPLLNDTPRLIGQTLGVLAYGNVAEATVRRAKAFGLNIIAHDPYITEIKMTRDGVEPVSFNELLERSDYLSPVSYTHLTLPTTPYV